MTDTAQPNVPMAQTARSKPWGALTLVALAALLVACAVFVPMPPFGPVVFAIGVTAGFVGAYILVSQAINSARTAQGVLAEPALYGNDPAAVLKTNGTGRVLYANPAALRLKASDPAQIASFFDGFFAAPQAAADMLVAVARGHGHACQRLQSSLGDLRLTVHQLEQDALLWRLDQSDMPQHEEDPLAACLPAMRIGPNSEVLWANPAMQELVGGLPNSVHELVADQPLRSGHVATLRTSRGQVEARLAIVDLPDGAKTLHVWPDLASSVDSSNADSIPVPLVQITPKGQIIMANARAKKLLALDSSDVMDFAEVIEGLGRPIDEWLLDVSEGRGAGRTEVVRAALPEQDVYLQVSLGRMVEHGDVSILAVLIDATELKTLEAQFVQSQKMQAIGQLAGGVAHDFNNLLTAISGHCDLLLLRHEPGDPNYGDLIQINQNANRAASLVGQLLAFSRKQNLQPELIDLRETLVDLTHLLNRLVGEKIHLRWTHESDLPRVRADKRQLEQVVMNLVVNARDAMHEGGNIYLETRNVSLREPMLRDRAEVPAGEYVLVQVRDEGRGIAPDKLQKIFEPFYSTKKTGEGTGLGLSMAYGIVKQSGGFIFADSIEWKGSTFTLYFPAHNRVVASLDQTAETAARSAPQREGGHVLLVEDEAPVRAFASRALQLRGYRVTEASCAEDALDLLDDKDLDIDIFVTDVVMPGMDGPTWVAKALEQRPDVRVVFVSGYAEDSVTHNRVSISNSSFLPKPFSLNQLTEAVQAQLN